MGISLFGTGGIAAKKEPHPCETDADSLEQATGIEPASSAWKADALADVLHPHEFAQIY